MLIAAALEPAATGIFVLTSPTLFGSLVLGEALSPAGQALGRLGGIVLIALALACWPPRAPAGFSPALLRAQLTYNLLTTIYLIYLGLGVGMAGILLWPAVVLHAILAMLLIRTWLASDEKDAAP